ncbi:hypothetical protein O1L60_07970 [Streptomyces diastatochromogenes]|nr:hypothetical protein [Streptomyces diastatochromogenes]
MTPRRAAATLLAAALLLAGCGGRATTHHKPGTSHQEATGSSGTLLAARDERAPAPGAPRGGRAHRQGRGPPRRRGRLERPPHRGEVPLHPGEHRRRGPPGRGHARLLVDGREAARLYGPWGYVPPGAHTLTVRLHADDHTVWAVAGAPVQATVRLGDTPPNRPVPRPRPRPPHPAAPPRPPTPPRPAARPRPPTPAHPPVRPRPLAPAHPPVRPRPAVPSAPPVPRRRAPAADPGRTVSITITGTTVQPPPSRIELKKGERLTLRVTSDRADTLHVHGYDRELPLPPGTPATLTLTVDRTGLFEVETHESGLVLTQLVVR